MNFAAIPSGESVFLDANVFVYAFADDPKLGDACVELLERSNAVTCRDTFRRL